MQSRTVPRGYAARQAAKSREEDARKRAAAASAMGYCDLHQSRVGVAVLPLFVVLKALESEFQAGGRRAIALRSSV